MRRAHFSQSHPSVLFRAPEDASTVGRGAPDCPPDLNLDQVIAAVTAGREGYELKPFFHAPLTEVDAVAGDRTFRLVEAEPLPTSFGEDVYRRVFGPTGGEVAAPDAGTLMTDGTV